MLWLDVSCLLHGEPMKALVMTTGQTTLQALEVSRLRVIAHMHTYSEVPCQRTLTAWQKAQDVASDMMLLHLRIVNLQHTKVKEETDLSNAVSFAVFGDQSVEEYDIVCEEDILEETCVL